jgi:hypothetical protein
MCFGTAIDDLTTNEIEMYEHKEPIELPTNGLEDFIDWDGLERGLDAGDFASQSDFRAEVQAQFEAAGVEYTRGYYRAAIKGLFPEYRVLYTALPTHATTLKETA